MAIGDVIMKKANLQEAKAQLSKLIKLASQGEEVIICNAGKPVARLIPFEQKKSKRMPGGWEGKVKISENFDQIPEKFMKNFN